MTENINIKDTKVPIIYPCDCHVHVIGPQKKYPFEATRSYTPVDATANDLVKMMDKLGLRRAVVVQPSIFGQDNRCTIDAIHKIEAFGLQARAVAVLEHPVPLSEIDSMHRSGVRGLRVNLKSKIGQSLEEARAKLLNASRLCERNGWHVQLFVDRSLISALLPEIQQLPVDLVLDHFGGLKPNGPCDPDGKTIMSLLESGRIWIKLSGNYRVAPSAFDSKIPVLAKDLASRNPDRLIWASDWPHTPEHSGEAIIDPPVKAYREIDTNRLLHWVYDWFDNSTVTKILQDNPAKLYDFSS